MEDVVPSMKDRGSLERISRHGIWLLCAVLLLAYFPSMGGGFLNWDDPWLLESNPILRRPGRAALVSIWSDFSLPTRYALGAEYLPLRDTSHLVEAWLFGIRAQPMRWVNWGVYLMTVVTIHRLFRKQLVAADAALVATAAFALHPVHVESVAWVAGRKDVLAMLFAAQAMVCYVSRGRWYRFGTAGWFALAMLSKSMSMALPLLLPLLDLWAKRRSNYRAILPSVAAVILIFPVHLYVGGLVGMIQARAGGDLSSALATMGPVWLRYVGVLLWPPQCSIVHDVPTLTRWTATAALGYAALSGTLVYSVWQWWRGRPLPIVALSFFLVPLLPVSQVIAPLQNRMADRYLWWSVGALAVVLAGLVRCLPRLGLAISLGVLAFWTAITAQRAALFGDSALVFADALRKTSLNGTAPYQLAMALEAQGDLDGARVAYEAVWQRTQGADEAARRASNNLARLEARDGHLERAERVLRRGLGKFPEDAKMRENLEKVLAMRNRLER